MRVPDPARAHKVCAPLLPSTFVTTRARTDDAEAARPLTLGDLLLDCADRLRRLPESRLNKVATAGRELAQALADAAAGIEARAAPTPPPGRLVPILGVFALADQVAVTAHDLQVAAAGLDPETVVWWDGARRPLQDVRDGLRGQAERVRAQT